MNVLTEHPFLSTSGTRNNFWVGQFKMDEVGQFFFIFFEISFTWAFQQYMTTPYLMKSHFRWPKIHFSAWVLFFVGQQVSR